MKKKGPKPIHLHARKGPKPKRGLPAHTVVGGKLNVTEVKAMKAVMKAKGIPTQSLFVALAVRYYAKANGVDIPDQDKAQLLLPVP